MVKIPIIDFGTSDYLRNNPNITDEERERRGKVYIPESGTISSIEPEYEERIERAGSTIFDNEVILKMSFSSTDELKKATINVNGNEFTMETKENEFKRSLTSLAKEGNNFIKIIPESEFNLEFLEITIE